MTTRLESYRAHCRRMATAEHKPECPSLPKNQPHWSQWIPECEDEGNIVRLRWAGPPPLRPTCDGCNSEADRAWFARLADEVEGYQQMTMEDA